METHGTKFIRGCIPSPSSVHRVATCGVEQRTGNRGILSQRFGCAQVYPCCDRLDREWPYQSLVEAHLRSAALASSSGKRHVGGGATIGAGLADWRVGVSVGQLWRLERCKEKVS